MGARPGSQDPRLTALLANAMAQSGVVVSHWQMSATQPDDRQKVADGDVPRAQNPGKFTRCHNIAIEIYPH
jgi:hypothetical protein